MQNDDQFEYDDEPRGKSKSQLKREMTALQDLGANLVKLSNKELARIPLPEELAEAIKLARSINSNSGLRRQMQYIGRLMREIDADPILRAYTLLHDGKRESAEQFHHIEEWRDRLIAEGDTALETFLADHPAAERQRLRQLLLNIKKEHEKNQPPKSARLLFRYLRELLEPDAEAGE
jgi:ribosome-associated protein